MTRLLGRSPRGERLIGSVIDAAANTHSFLYGMKSKSYLKIDDPNARGMAVVNGLNKGQLVGFYLDAAGNTDGMLVQVIGQNHGS